ncbi:hypothetical protein Tco_0471536 [Tanacetum coccineum]
MIFYAIIRAAVEVLSYSGVAPYNEATLEDLKTKHPFKPPPSLPHISIDLHHLVASPAVVLDRIKSFPRGMSYGRDGLRAQHLMDCLSGADIAISDELARKIYIELGSASGIRACRETLNDENPPPPPPPQTQTPTQQALHTISTIKLLILKKGEYDIWAMKMEHYLAHTDYPIWEVIQRGYGPVSVSTDTNDVIKVLPPKTTEEILARERERKARTTLLMALPEDHLTKFHKMTNAKDMWEATNLDLVAMMNKQDA